MSPRIRSRASMSKGTIPRENTALSSAIEKAHPGFDARSMNEAQANFGSLMGQVDSFLLMTVSLALVRGDRRDHQHDADEHDRAVRRVRRAAGPTAGRRATSWRSSRWRVPISVCSPAWSAACWRRSARR